MHLSVTQVLALSGLALLLGYGVHRAVPLTAHYSLPRSVLGGLIMAAILAISESLLGQPIDIDLSAQTPLMVAFFATLGFGASWTALRSGGRKVFWFFGISILLLVVQNIMGITLALVLDQPALFGVLTSSVSLVGGPGTALAFAPLFAENGVAEAATVGLTTAMGGILIAGLTGGPVSTWLIKRYRLDSSLNLQTKGFGKGLAHQEESISLSALGEPMLKHVVMLLAVMALGAYVAQAINSLGVTLPIYIGSMLVAAVIRNIDDSISVFKINEHFLDALGSVALSIFIAMSLMGLEWGKLADLAGPMAAALFVQALVVVGLCMTLIFRLYGRNYESAVLAGGMVGFMMGTTANAMANLQAITKKYGPAPFAYFVIPLVGACFIDFANAAIISVFINIFR